MKRLFTPIRWLGRVLRGLRRLLADLLTLAVLVIGALAAFNAMHHPGVPHAAALRVAPRGRLVYSYSGSALSRALERAVHRSPGEVSVRDLTTAIDRAARDPRIKVLALDLREFQGGSLPQVLSVARAIRRFHDRGKPVYAYAPNYSQSAYALAAPAGHIFLNPLGAVLITGYADQHLYFKKLLERLGVRVYAFRKGEYKSAVEPLVRTDMSQAARTENRAWLQTWWSTYQDTVAAARGLPAARIARYAEHLPRLLTRSDGDAAQLALQQHLVTRVADYGAFRRAVARVVTKHASVNFPEIGVRHYLNATRPAPSGGAVVAVVPIDGPLVDGTRAVTGAVVAGPTVAQLDRLVHEHDVRAVVLQVNSPGGSVYAADAIRHAVMRLRHAGKTVVVSMGTLGASGAYWLSTAAQRIYAHRTTITADIGVFALYPDFSGSLSKLGVGVSGVATTSTAKALSGLRPIPPRVAAALQASVDHIYRRFVDLVAQARGLSPTEVDRIAQGRAWSGADALPLKLIDGLGGLNRAVRAAAHLAELKPGAYHVDYLPRAGTSGWAQALAPAVSRAVLGPDLSRPLEILRALDPTAPLARGLGTLLTLLRVHPHGPLAFSPIVPP